MRGARYYNPGETPDMERIRVVLCEDHALVREGTRRILAEAADLEVLDEAGDGRQALALIERHRPDVAVLDIRMPELSGLDVLRRLRSAAPATQVLMLTAYDDDEFILAAMEAGASGYLLKTARPAELLDAIRRVHAGEPVLQPAIATKVARLWQRGATGRRADLTEPLSPREREVLELAASGLRNRVIAERLGISSRTVEGHFNSILAKLGVASRLEAVLFAIAHEWIAVRRDEQRTIR